jgi:hypothetical protein
MDVTRATPLVRSFERHLRAANRAPTTVATYLHAIRQAHGFLQARGTRTVPRGCASRIFTASMPSP